MCAGFVAPNPPRPTQRQQWRGQHAPYRSRAAPATAGAPRAVPPGGLPKNNITESASDRYLFPSCAQALSLQIPPAPPSASSGGGSTLPIGHVLPPPLLSLPMQSPQGGFPNKIGKFQSSRYQFPSCAQALSLRIPPAPPSACSGWGSTLPIGRDLPQPLLALPMQSPQGGFPNKLNKQILRF